MKVIPSPLPEVFLIEPDVFGDSRGFFMESWNSRRYADAGLDLEFVQDNVSQSGQGILRGLHFQNPHPQGKLVFVLVGEVYDVVVDIRVGSPTFGQSFGATLSAENHRQMFVPEGFAHGFCVVSEMALFAYKCTGFYDSAAEHSLRWDDPALGLDWPLDSPILSEKDQAAKCLDEFDRANLPVYQPATIRMGQIPDLIR